MLNATALSGSSNVEARAKTLYNKAPGVLTFTNTRVQWTRDGETRPTVNVAHSKVSSKRPSMHHLVLPPFSEVIPADLFCTKEGSAKKKLKLNAVDQEDAYLFHFTAAPAVAEAELATFKRLLLEVITQNTSKSAPTTAASGGSRASSASPASRATPSPASRASPVPAHSRSPSAGPSKNQPYSFEVYQKVLTKLPELAALHRDLVEGGQITETEFWEGREV